MHVKSILNKVEKQRGFVYQDIKWDSDDLVISIIPRKNCKGTCSGCGKKRPGYDHLPERKFYFVPLWNISVIFLYCMRRVDCPECGITVEIVPWGNGKSKLTRTFSLFLASWAKRLSWSEVALIFNTSWGRVYDSVQWVVEYGLQKRDISAVKAIGVDEVQYQKGHNYLTLVYQIDEGARRLLYIGKNRTKKTLLRFFYECGPNWCLNIEYVCSDMWKPYIKVIEKKLTNAIHILDRFHIIANLNKKLNVIRASEARNLAKLGYEDILVHTKYCFLKNPENLTEKQELKLKDVLQYDLKSVRAYLLKESFQLFWKYSSPYWASWFLEKWCRRAMRSRLEPIKDFVRMIRKHEPLIMNWFKAKKSYSSGIVEGLNRKVNLVTRKAYGYRTYDVLKIALFHTLGDLPEPKFTHRFW